MSLALASLAIASGGCQDRHGLAQGAQEARYRPLVEDDNDGLTHALTPLGGEIDVVVADSELAIAGLSANQTAFNPTMVAWGEGALAIFRRDTEGGEPDMQLGIVALDGNFVPTGQPSYLDLRPPQQWLHTAEDPRAVWHEGELYVVYNQRLQSASYFPRVMYLARIGHLPAPAAFFAAANAKGGTAHVPSLAPQVTLNKHLVAPPPIPFQRVEKNWTPFSQGGELKLLYYSNPPVVLGLTAAQLEAPGDTLVPYGPVEGAPRLDYAWGEIRGGTGAFLQQPPGPRAQAAPWPAGTHASAREGELLASPWVYSGEQWAGGGSRFAAGPAPRLAGGPWGSGFGGFAYPPVARQQGSPSGERSEVAANSAPHAALDLAGPSSPAPDDGATYEAFFHTRLYRPECGSYGCWHLSLGYYSFSAAAPYPIVRYAPASLLVPAAQGLAEDRRTRLICSYPGGFIRRGDYYYVIYGHQDLAVRLLQLDAAALQAHTVAAP